MIKISRAGVAGLILCSVVGLSCAAHLAANEGTEENAPPAEDQATAELQEHHQHHHHGGFTRFVAMSLDTLGVDDAERPEVERLQGELQACTHATGELERNLLEAVADGVAAGALDPAKIEPLTAVLEPAAATEKDCSNAALNRLHDLLSAAEREALIDKVTAHWEVWRQVNHDDQATGHERGDRLARLADELHLTADQVQRIASATAPSLSRHARSFDRRVGDAQLHELTTAFQSDTFDASAITDNAHGHLAAYGSKRMVLFYEAVAPVLTPEQRAQLAEHLREHANRPPVVSEN